MGGIMSITGPEDGCPTRIGASIGDIIAGMFTAYGIMLALFNREKTGKGQKIDVGMLDCQLAILENAIARYDTLGIMPKPLGNRHPAITPFDSFTAKDGYIVIGAGNDNLWEKLCTVLKSEKLINDERFVTNSKRTSNSKKLKDILNSILKKKNVADWLVVMEQAGIPCGPINNIGNIVNDHHIRTREMIVEIEHPVAGSVKMPGIPVKMSDNPGSVESPSPILGQHTHEVLKEVLGWSEAEIKKNYME
jgi:CoA:oxalate CoA-transferase